MSRDRQARRSSRHKLRGVSRRKPTKEPKARIFVAAEGRVSEPLYLRDFERLHGHESVQVVALRHRSSDPRSVVTRVKEEKSRAGRDALSGRDTYWAMFDRDEHVGFAEAVDMARANDIGLAVSIPCFELWAILHYEDWDKPSHRGDDCQRRLAKLCDGYRRDNKRFDDVEAIESNHDQAVTRARNLLHRRIEDDDPLGDPSTTVHCLTEQIRRGVEET